MKYNGKSAYKGDIVSNYEKDRVVETIWQKEQDWLSAFLQTIPDGSKILDLPVGTGRFLELYAEKKLEIFGFDISADMIALSNTKLAGITNNHANVTLNVSDAEKISLENNAVDYIVCFRLFHLIPFEIIKKILKEFYRVSNKKVIIEIFNSSLAIPRPKSIKRHIKDLLVYFKNKLSAPTPAPSQETQDKPWFHINNYTYNSEALTAEFKRVGFTQVLIENINDAENPVTIFILSK